MKSRLVICSCIAGMALFLTGCIWIRLLSFKNQLADFDRYVQVDDQEGLSFHFNKPIVRSQDIRQLLEVDPTSIVTNQNCITWFWTFEKQFPPGVAESNIYDITFATSFTNNYLCRLSIPDDLLAFIPKTFVEGMFRSLGKAKINKMSRALNAQWNEAPGQELKLLSQSELHQLLGAPFTSTNSGQTTLDLYLYKPKSPSLNPSSVKPARVECVFSHNSGQLIQVKASYLSYQAKVSFVSSR